MAGLKITWNDMSGLIDRLFCEGRAPHVLRTLWGCLGRDGMTTYQSEEERSRVLLHGVALTLMLKECWTMAGQPNDQLDFADVPLALGIPPRHLTQLYYSEFPVKKNLDYHTSPELLRTAIIELTDALRPEISVTLRAETGDDELVALLLEPVLRTEQPGEGFSDLQIPRVLSTDDAYANVRRFIEDDFHRRVEYGHSSSE